ncbi:MAG: adenylate/guanylate cyclase domain-containing protein [Chitinophagales bacterium]
MKKIIQYFIPVTIPTDADSQRKARFTVAVWIIIAYFNLNYIIISYFIDYPGGIISQLPLMLITIACLLLYKNKFPPFIIYPFYFISCSISIAATVYYTGGFSSLLISWLATTPIVAVLVWSKKGARYSVAFVILIELMFYFLHVNDYVFPNQIDEKYHAFFYLTTNIGLPLILFWVAIVFENAKDSALNSLNIALKDLSIEKKRSDELLLNILPSEVVNELKITGSSKAKTFSMVTVMFTDFKDFTDVSEKISGELLVDEINYCFSAFDTIIQKYKIEKIKTVGDAYICVGGMPELNYTHSADILTAAIEIRDFMLNRKKEKELRGEIPFLLRIGINTGPVVAGIVGIKKFAYDIWGDTVNIASRMESSGEEGKINISGATYELVKNKFNCTYRGKIPAKNKGDIDMYFVENTL